MVRHTISHFIFLVYPFLDQSTAPVTTVTPTVEWRLTETMSSCGQNYCLLSPCNVDSVNIWLALLALFLLCMLCLLFLLFLLFLQLFLLFLNRVTVNRQLQFPLHSTHWALHRWSQQCTLDPVQCTLHTSCLKPYSVDRTGWGGFLASLRQSASSPLTQTEPFMALHLDSRNCSQIILCLNCSLSLFSLNFLMFNVSVSLHCIIE